MPPVKQTKTGLDKVQKGLLVIAIIIFLGVLLLGTIAVLLGYITFGGEDVGDFTYATYSIAKLFV